MYFFTGAGKVSNIQVAEILNTKMNTSSNKPSWLSECQTGRGFLNLYVKAEILAQIATLSVLNAPCLMLPLKDRKTVAVDFSSPNIAKGEKKEKKKKIRKSFYFDFVFCDFL